MKMLEQAGHTTYTRIVKVLLQRMERACERKSLQ